MKCTNVIKNLFFCESGFLELLFLRSQNLAEARSIVQNFASSSDSHSVRQASERWFSIIRLRRVSGDKVTLVCLIVTKVQYLNQALKMADAIYLTAKVLDGCGRNRPFVYVWVAVGYILVFWRKRDPVFSPQIPDLSLSCMIYRKKDQVFFLLWSICDLE